MSNVKKRFPADTQMEVLTFLNDKKVDGELYSLLQSYSFPVEENGQIHTILQIRDLPTKKSMCQILGIKSPKTFNSHFQYLIERGFVEEVEKDVKYILPNKEDIYFMIPLETMQYLNNTVQEFVIKIFVYLGQRWKFKRGYVFTATEIANHLGLPVKGCNRNYEKIGNALDLLSRLGLITFVTFNEGVVEKKRLIGFSLYIQDKIS